MSPEQIMGKCKSLGCEHYFEWDFGYEICISCALQGQSYIIDEIADNCPHKDKFTEQEEQR